MLFYFEHVYPIYMVFRKYSTGDLSHCLHKKTHRLLLLQRYSQVRNLYVFFLFCGDGRVPYNAGNTTGFSNVGQENFKIGCFSYHYHWHFLEFEPWTRLTRPRLLPHCLHTLLKHLRVKLYLQIEMFYLAKWFYCDKANRARLFTL